jgi:PhzF family phenazine biosynthesis protein
MTTYEFDWVDAFTLTPFGGNGCAVCYGADDIPAETRMAIVRETNLSECAYIVKSDKADFGARYYLAGREILMAGHPTVATIRSLVHRGLIDVSSGRAELTLEVGAGVLPIEVTMENGEPLITMTQVRPVFGETSDPGEIAAIFGLEAGDIVGTPRTVSTGTPFCITVLSSREAIDRASQDVGRLEAWRGKLGHPRSAVMEPFLVVMEGAETGDTYGRLMLAPPSPAEDPFTGSATGCMAAYIWNEGLIDRPDFIAEQGHGMGRPGMAKVSVLGPRDDISGVRVSGHGIILMDGRITLP